MRRVPVRIKQAEKRKRDADMDYIPDTFDTDAPRVESNAICAICRGGWSEGVEMKKHFPEQSESDSEDDAERSEIDILDPSRVWASLYPIRLRTNATGFVHYACALYSPCIWLRGQQWHNIKGEVTRGRGLDCYFCKTNGATLKCSQKCQFITHIPCAIKNGWEPSPILGVSSYKCPVHVAKIKAEEFTKDMNCDFDFSKGRELVPVVAHPRLQVDETQESPNSIKQFLPSSSSVIRKEFIYCAFNCHFNNAVLPILSKDEHYDKIKCCNCRDGYCLDETCECLMTFPTGVAYGLPSECGERCRCHIRRCANRVSQNGVNFHLEIFPALKTFASNRFPNTSVSESKEEIPRNASNTISTPIYWFDDDRDLVSEYDDAFDPKDEENLDVNEVLNDNGVDLGVRTLNYISKDSFICEIVGQYKLESDLLMELRQRSVYCLPVAIDSSRSGDLDEAKETIRFPVDENCRIIAVDQWTQEEYRHVFMKTTTDAPWTFNEHQNHLAKNDRRYCEANKNSSLFKEPLYLDCRKYSNVGSFVRYRGVREKGVRNLIRGYIYKPDDTTRDFPKLVLYASRNIRSGEELLL